MTGITIEQVTEAVGRQLGALKDDLRQHVDDQTAKALEPVASEVAQVRTKLAELEARGDVNPTDERVQDLEKRLAEAEEQIRLAGAHPSLPANQLDVPDFRGAFIPDINKLRQAVQQVRGMGPIESRAIDSALFVTGGGLEPEVADQFIDFLVEKQAALSRVQVRRMMNNQGHTDELTVTARKMRKAAEGTPPTVANAVGTVRRTLTTVETIWGEDITLTFLEDNIERRGAEAHIARMLATAYGNDANDLAWNGSEAETGDDFLSINDGWISLATADGNVNEVDLDDSAYASSNVTATWVLQQAIQAMPFRFKGRDDLTFFVPVRFAEQYADELSQRETGLGDQVVVNGFPAMRYFGRPVVPEPHLYNDNGDKLMLTPTGNLFFGIQRQMTVDSEWQPRKRVVEYTMTMRTDYQYATGSAIVLVSNLPEGLQAL